ncbi:MAG: adenylate/guanylate cyclase domain-containing protein [Devosiaceae bacterium]|nr:adenylate/guanylate cyclase domain-containing protein [Devosiaceae bacterium MH13]
MRQTLHRLLPALAGLLILAACIGVRAADPDSLSALRERTFDFYQRVAPREIGPEVPVRIVDIDDAALAQHGQWPWPRDLLADLVTTLHAAGAAVIALDMIFPEPDRSSPLAALARLPVPADTREALSAMLASQPDHDDQFAQALAAAPSVLGVALSVQPRDFRPRAGLATVGPPIGERLARSPGTLGSLPHLEAGASGLGGIHVSVLDDDAVVRRIPVLTATGDAILPSLFLEALRVAQGAQSLVARTNPDPSDPEHGIPQDVRVGAFTIPLTATGAYRILYGALDPALTVSAGDVLSAAGDAQAIAGLSSQLGGTIVLVGTSAPGLFDLRASPLGTLVPGVTMHAQAIASIVTEQNLSRPDWTQGLELTAMATLGIAALVIALLAPPVWAAFICLILLAWVGAGSWWAFSERLLLVDATSPIFAILAVFGAVTVPRLVGTDRQQRFIRNAFSHYLAEPVLARLEADPNALQLDGEKRIITVLFMDVRGCTSRSEGMEPTDAVHLLNGLLDPLSEAVLAEEGTIDKFMGDGMMAFWNAPLDQPDHAARAIRAAAAMADVLEETNRKLGSETPLAIGVGIHTGDAFVGNMGSRRRFAYSAIGDTVNLCARVEALAGQLQQTVLVTEKARAAATENSDPEDASTLQLLDRFEEAGEHMVKGREQAVRVYALKPDPRT